MPAIRLHRAVSSSPADRLPSGGDWVHEIKHDGYRLMARRDPIGIRLITRNGHDWSPRYPLIVEAVNRLKVRSCLIDGEAVVCDDNGLAVFERLRKVRRSPQLFLCAFDLLNLTARICGASHLKCARRRWRACYARAFLACNSISISHTLATSSSGTPAPWASKASSRSGSARATSRAGRRTG
jgi:ATP-dependent DNA ligase